jgi:hypothetical protein
MRHHPSRNPRRSAIVNFPATRDGNSDAAPDLAQSVTVALDLGFFQDVVSERRFLIPTHRAKSGLLPSEGSSADMARDDLAGREPNGVAAPETAPARRLRPLPAPVGPQGRRLDVPGGGSYVGRVDWNSYTDQPSRHIEPPAGHTAGMLVRSLRAKCRPSPSGSSSTFRHWTTVPCTSASRRVP